MTTEQYAPGHSETRPWVLLSRDKLRHPGEKDAVAKHGARMFRIAKRARNADEQIAHITTNINRVVQRSRKPGPCIYRVDSDRIEKAFPR